jgi:hypothetical protein
VARFAGNDTLVGALVTLVVLPAEGRPLAGLEEVERVVTT